MKHPILDIINLYFQKTGYFFNEEEVALQISTHAEFPNLIAVSDLFHHFGIDHYALRLNKEKGIIENLPKFFLAHCMIDHEPTLVLVQKNKDLLKLYYNQKKIINYNFDDFLQLWTGVMLSFKEVPIASLVGIGKKKLIKNLVYGVVVSSIIVIFLQSNSSFIEVFWLFTSLIGLAIAGLIVQHELGFNLNAVHKICKSFENTSCDAVISSDGASLMGLLKLSDLGVIYFTAQTLFIIIASFSTNLSLNPLIWSSILSVPVIAYSLIYQGVILKKWCPLCLGIVGILSIQLLIVFSTTESLVSLTDFTIFTTSIYSFLFATITSIWLFVRPLLDQSIELKKLSFENLRFKRNFDFFSEAYHKMPLLSRYYKSKEDLVFGNQGANLKITLVTNPLCYYCVEAHEVLDNLLKAYGDRFELTIRFNIINSSEHNKAAQIAHYFLKVFNDQGTKECLKQISGFYKQKDKMKWLSEIDQNLEPTYFDLLYSHYNWCKEQSINFTPALCINSRLYPKKYYKIKELPYFMEDFIQLTQQNETLQPSIQ
ncbi:vitamin K epoxide reductase family protein [Ascidiimonas sp. W6]|uniref:vitamin K epoxide reductase family protein n=1 Tax=Ascidiimonas meishanensis TaxID=3128903 RepID=UPI0030EDF5EF